MTPPWRARELIALAPRFAISIALAGALLGSSAAVIAQPGAVPAPPVAPIAPPASPRQSEVDEPIVATEYKVNVTITDVSDLLRASRYRDLVLKNLALLRRSDDRRATRDRLRRLTRGIPDEVTELMATEGYFNARASIEIQDTEAPWQVNITVTAGPVTRVTDVRLTFDGAIQANGESEPNASSAERVWALASGQVFTQEAWGDAKRAVLRHLLARRFPAARLSASNAEIDPETNTARLTVVYDSGPEYRFGELEINGLQRYSDHVVRALNAIRPGDAFSQAAIADLQTRLQSTPYFSSVSITADPNNANPNALVVRVDLVEAQRRLVEFGVGYRTDTGARLQASYADINFVDRGIHWRNLLRLEEKLQSASTQLTWPVRLSGWQDDVALEFRKSDVRGLLVQALSLNYKYTKTAGRIERGFLTLATVSREQPEGGERTLRRALVPGYAWRYRAFDDLIDPRNGYELLGEVGAGTKAVLSDQNFIRVRGRIVALWSPTTLDTFVDRLEGGVVSAESRTGIPNQLLFRAGGDHSLRGYAFQSIGVSEAGAIVGGRYLAIMGAEYIRWVWPRFGLATFYEQGNAFDDSNSRAWRKWNPGYGVGVRARTPIGPVNADVAYGQSARSLRIHLSLGFVF